MLRISTVALCILFSTACKKEEKKVEPVPPADKPADMAGSAAAKPTDMAGSDKTVDKPADGSGSAAMAGSGSAAAASDKPETFEPKWEKYTSKEGKYEIELPTTPKEQEAQGMKIVGSEFGVTAKDDRTAMCGVAFMALPGDAAKADPKTLLDGATARHKQGAEVIEEKDLKLGKVPGRSLVVKNASHQKWMRVFVNAGTIYIANCGGPFDRADKDGPIATKALDSFKFTK